ncbi:MAG TPA: HD domain-containing protein [Pyrinomonadaceae bacterium]|nr:HD domain-containing protein [Pyrinomonadaceae bacterium]
MIDLIDTPEFQRLRRIRQLGIGFFTYQGAEHSRFTHSLGALHLANRILDKLQPKYNIPAKQRTAVMAAALLHDIGHGPFSHLIESILGFHHEDWTVKTVLSDETEVGKLLRAFSAELPESVAAIIGGTFQPVALAQLISSQLDVDRMDYLLRDSLMTGVKYGIYDLEWIIRSLEIDTENDRLYLSARGLYAVEDYLQARYYMFRQVYFHRTLRSAEAILRSLFRRALEICSNGGNIWHAENSAFSKVLHRRELSLADHIELDDHDVIFHIKRWTQADDPVLRDLSRRFIHRRLFKAFDLDMPEGERTQFIEAAFKVVAEAGFDPEYYLIEDRAGDIPYYFYTSEKAEPKALIYVQDGFSRPQIREISEISAAVRGLQKGYQIHRLCFPPEVEEKISALYQKTVV